MPSIIFSLLLLFFTDLLIEPTTCALPANLQNLELDDITSLWDKFPLLIGKIKEAVNRFRCPKGWRRLGGSCYYLSNVTSLPTEANHTCNLLHSNHSNLMQIRNTVELFYAAHVLTKNNLSALMIDIDPSLLKGKKIAEILMDDQGRWQRMKEKFRELRIRYYKLKERILNELDDAGLRISRRSKKVKQSVKKKKEKFVDDHIDSDVNADYDYSQEQNITNSIQPNETTTTVDEYEYDDIDSTDEGDEFEHLEDIRGICDQLDWNVLTNDSTVYILTTYLISDKIVCSISDVEPDIEYEHACEYVLDFCFANIVCGKHGRCVNTLAGFKCSCSFLYGGLLCEKISKQGTQILIGFGLIILLYGLSFKPIRWALYTVTHGLVIFVRGRCKMRKRKKKNEKKKLKEDKQKLVATRKTDDDDNKNLSDEEQQMQIQQRRPTIAQEIMEFLLPRNVDPLRNPTKRDLVRLFWVGGLSILFLSLLFSITTITHFTSFKYDITDDTKLELLVNDTVRLVTQCERISNYRIGNLIFFPIALCLILIFSWSVKREKRCLNMCDGRPGLIPPIEPFRTANRFTTATVFGILAFEVLKIFEELLFSTGDPLNHGVLVELLERIAIVILVGLRYYPVLASLQLRNVVARFFVCLYILGDIVYAIIREGSCMGFLPLSRYYSALEEAKLRMELGTWFIIYGLIKNTPHFIFLSYIGAELCIRFGYDSIYVPLKKKQSIWLSPVVQRDESEFAKYYVTKLFRRNLPKNRTIIPKETNPDQLQDFEHEAEYQEQANQSRVKNFFASIYHWDEDFRFTTIATCTYTVAIVFLYYLACTFVFLYISRTTGHISFIRYYVESTLNIEFKGFFSLRTEIILSAVITVLVYGFQLFLGMQNYKKHRLQLYKGIYEDVPSAANFKPNSIAAKSVHYSGFLVGYMAWGFVICFHLIFFTLSAIRIISLQLRYIELILAICVPVLVVYLLKMLSTSSAGKFLFVQDMDEKLNLKNRKTYAIFVYFNFFADCFLGIASCIIRLIKATFLNVVYMARLDCSFLGRPLEKFDLGFAAYVSYLHMEATHTNPIMLAFCYSLYDDVILRRPNSCYDDECCIAPGELHDDIEVIEQNPKEIKRLPSNKSDHHENGSVKKKTKSNAREPESPARSLDKNHSITGKRIPTTKVDDDDGDGLSIKEVVPKKKSPSPSSTSDKDSQKSNSKKSKQQKLNIDNDIEEEDDGGPSPPIISTVARLVPQAQPRLPLPSAPVPELPVRDDNPSDTNESADDGGLKPQSISTVSKIIPKEAPFQRSSPPRVPTRQDQIFDDEQDEEDDDGGVKPKSISTVLKIIPQQKPHLVPFQKSTPPGVPSRRDPIDDDEDEDDDGGVKPKSISTVLKIIPQQKPHLVPFQQSTPPRVPSRRDPIDDDEDDDEDGGVKPKSISTVLKIIPQKKPHLVPFQQSNVPRVPQRQDQISDDDDDDGGIDPRKIAKQKQELAEKKKKKEEAKKKKQLDKTQHLAEDEDEDGGISKKKHEADIKKKKTEQAKPTKKPQLDDDDEDGGVSKQKLLAAEKKKQELEAKKKKAKLIKAKLDQDNDEDDDGAPKRREPIKKKPSKSKPSQSTILKEEDEDDDGGRIVKTYDTVRMMMPVKKPLLSNQTKKEASPEATDDGSMLTSRPPQQPLLASYDTVGRMVPKVSTDFQNIKSKRTSEENHYDTIPTEEEHAARLNSIYSPPSYDQASNLHLLRNESYRDAQQSTPPLTNRRPIGSSIRSNSNTNEDSSHYSEITSDTTQSGVINRSYSHTGSIQSSSNQSIKQASKHSSEHTLKEEEQTEESTVETEEEEEEEEEEQNKPLRKKPASIQHISTAFTTISHLIKPEQARELEKIRRKKQARFRWFLAYTIINNYHLFDLRKQAQSRLALLRIQRSNLIDDEKYAVPAEAAMMPESPKARKRNITIAKPISYAAAPPEQRPPATHRLLSIPVPVHDDFPQSPAERYITIRSCMLYDVNAQQANTPHSSTVSRVPSTINQQNRGPTSYSAKSLGFSVPPEVVIQAPSDSSTKSKDKRPSYQRQESHFSNSPIIVRASGTPIFQGVPDSNQSTADYPMANGSSITNLSTLRSQMSHAQHMQAWRQTELKKILKKRPHCYVYGPPPQRSTEEKLSTAAILTPQIIVTTPNQSDNAERLPSNSPFQYPHDASENKFKTINEKARRQISPAQSQRLDRIDENTAEKSLKKKSLRTTSALIHRKDSQGSLSNATEV